MEERVNGTGNSELIAAYQVWLEECQNYISYANSIYEAAINDDDETALTLTNGNKDAKWTDSRTFDGSKVGKAGVCEEVC